MPKDLFHLPARNKNGAVHVVIESPRGSPVKLKYDPELRAFTVSRPLPWGLAYPFDWGFVPSTRAPDGDPLDAMVMWDVPSSPGVVIPCRAVGVLQAEQDKDDGKGRERNDRVLFVPLAATRSNDLQDIKDIEPRQLDELAQFFLATVALEKKHLKILGWGSAKEADRLIDKLSEG